MIEGFINYVFNVDFVDVIVKFWFLFVFIGIYCNDLFLNLYCFRKGWSVFLIKLNFFLEKLIVFNLFIVIISCFIFKFFINWVCFFVCFLFWFFFFKFVLKVLIEVFIIRIVVFVWDVLDIMLGIKFLWFGVFRSIMCSLGVLKWVIVIVIVILCVCFFVFLFRINVYVNEFLFW